MKKENTQGKILVIEDDEPTREAILLKFSQLGYDADFAENGEGGFKKLRNGNFDVVLLDLRMPKGDGFVFLQKKQKVKAFREIPAVVFSNFSQPEFVNRALNLGARGYLVKANHSIQEIAQEVIDCLTKKQCRIDR